MKRASFCALLVLIVGVVAVATPSAQMRGLGRISGQVVDDGGSPVADVDVTTATMDGNQISGKSSAEGKFTLAGLGRGEWLVTFKKSGFADKRVKLVIEKELMANQPFKVTMVKG